MQITSLIFEILKLFFIITIIITCLLTFIWLNYLTWNKRYYFFILSCLGFGCALTASVVLKCDEIIVYSIFAFFTLSAYTFKFFLRGRFKSPVYFCAPAFFGVFLLFIYPIFFELYLSFHNLNLGTLSEFINTGKLSFVGLENYKEVLKIKPGQESFFEITQRTLMWTAVNLFFHVTFGVLFALLLNSKIKFFSLYRTILILPWAIPQLIAVLALRGEFQATFGLVNQLLESLFHIEGRPWLSEPRGVFMAYCIVNIWLGIPFMMVVALSGLQAIPKSYYEAASLDGANVFQQFKSITLPLLKPTMLPAIILGTIWTFNNVNVVYLMTGGGTLSVEGADILVSDLYRQAFLYYRYSYSAAYAVIIFIILVVFSLLFMKATSQPSPPKSNR
ncbi:MAG: sugar ABC transporter permease [Silvanigrellaceae bacterium]|nr:sugar ABC transporter permease [Silvanigrellaceae bacterium]